MIPVPEMKMIDCIFGNIDHLPKWENIPEEFKNQSNKWVKIQQKWFFEGIKTEGLIPKEGVDKLKAIAALSAIQCSWAPKHEHKEAGVAYLLSEWFSDFDFTLFLKEGDNKQNENNS